MPMIMLINKIKKIPTLFKDVYDELIFFIKELKVSIYRIEASSRLGDTLVIYYVGRKKMPDYFFNKFYPTHPVLKIESKLYFWQLKSRLKSIEKKTHLLFVKTHKLLRKFLKSDFIVIPEYIKQILDVNKDDEEIKKGFHKNLLGTELRRIRKYKYTYEVSKDADKIEFFYNEMFIPLMKKRHGEYARLDSLEAAKKVSTEGVLFIKKDNKYVAGATLQKKGSIIITRKFGVINGDDNLLRQSVIAAIYFFLIKFAKENNYKKVDFGFTKPILSDGILIYKNKWGSKIEYVPWERSIFMLRICDLNSYVKKILIDNPLITIIDSKLVGYAFSDKSRAPKIDGLNITVTPDYFKGLDFVKTVSLN